MLEVREIRANPDRLREAIRLRHYSQSTEKAYIGWVRHFILFHGKRHLLEMGAAEINPFLTDLAVNGHVATSTQNQALKALLFLYKAVLEVDPGVLEGAVRVKRAPSAWRTSSEAVSGVSA